LGTIEVYLETEILSATELGKLADHFWDTKQKRLAADKVSAALKTQESACEAKLIEQMLKQQISATGGGEAIFTLPAPTMAPVVQDWAKVWQYAKETDSMEFFEKRIGRAAVKERWDAGVEVPGVGKFPVYKLSKQGVKK
jgi:hypothetical protein